MEDRYQIGKNKQYMHFISLGYFCSVAQELEKYGLRSESSPFDWCRTSSFEHVIRAIRNGFAGYLKSDDLVQQADEPYIYKNIQYVTYFHHDFDVNQTLEQQLPGVANKYARRIDRFYRSIREPTLFFRYVTNEKMDEQGRSEETRWIDAHFQEILNLLRSFNRENDLILIANTGVASDTCFLYHAVPDENDCVARKPTEKNGELKELLESFDYPDREKNLAFSQNKQPHQGTREDFSLRPFFKRLTIYRRILGVGWFSLAILIMRKFIHKVQMHFFH